MIKIYFSLVVLILFGCRKPPQSYDNTALVADLKMPVYSETGSNTFGFLMNNEIWTVFGDHYSAGELTPGGWYPNELGYGYGVSDTSGKKMFTITGEFSLVKQSENQKQYVATMFFVPEPPFLKKYFLLGTSINVLNGNFGVTKVYENFDLTDRTYVVQSKNPFMLELTRFDTVARVCSGRFSGVIYNYYNPDYDSLAITNGRFDSKF